MGGARSLVGPLRESEKYKDTIGNPAHNIGKYGPGGTVGNPWTVMIMTRMGGPRVPDGTLPRIGTSKAATGSRPGVIWSRGFR